MNRGEPLHRTGFANRGGPLAKVSAKRLAALGGFARSTFSPKSSPKPAVPAARSPRVARHVVPAEVSRLVQERSDGMCEIGLEGCWGWGREKHHRISQKAGGRHGAAAGRSDRPSNILLLCVFCHLVVTNCPRWAYENGAALRERQEPTAEPVLYRGDLVYLDDAGEIHSFEEVGA